MDNNGNIGYTKDEYYQISEKQGLPKRCPILANCCRAVETRYQMGMRLGRSDISFDEFIHSYNQKWDPANMIRSIEQVSWSYTHDVLTSVKNACPEVTLFEPEYLPFNFRQSAFGNGSYYKDTRRFEAEAKHFGECAEFSEYLFQTSEDKIKGLGTKNTLVQIPEKKLEEYLANNIEVLEPGLKFIERQKTIGKWKVDIFASDASGCDVLIELKSKLLNRDEIDKLCGQVSRYYHRLKSKTRDLRMFIVVPKDNRDFITNLHHGLKPLIDNDKVIIFQFDYTLYGKEFNFSKVIFEK